MIILNHQREVHKKGKKNEQKRNRNGDQEREPAEPAHHQVRI